MDAVPIRGSGEGEVFYPQMFIGDGAKMVRDAFALAKEKAPAIIFIDELDAIGTKVGCCDGFEKEWRVSVCCGIEICKRERRRQRSPEDDVGIAESA